MPVSAVTLRKLMDAGLEGSALLDVVASIDADTVAVPPVRTARQERNARYYARKRLKASEQDALQDALQTSPEGSSPTPPSPNPPKEKTPKGVQKKTPRTVLQSVLSETQAAAVLDHRQRLRKPLSERAAELLAAKLAVAPQSCGLTPDDAADLMIEKGWQSFEPQWALNARPIQVKPTPTPEATDQRWQVRLGIARRERQWSGSEWGPPPGMPGCMVPKHLLEPDDGQGWREYERAA